MEAEEEEREGRREGEVRLKTWEEVQSQLAPVDLAKAVTMDAEKKDEEEEDKSEEEEEEERRGAENQEDGEDEEEKVECRSSPGPSATPSVASSRPLPPTTSSPPPLERSR